MKGTIKQTFRIESPARLKDALEIMKTGIITSKTTGRPTFIDKTKENALKVMVFGRSALEEYEKRFPSLLSKTLGGNKEAGEAEKLRSEQMKGREEDTKTAVEAVKFLSGNHTREEKVAYFMNLRSSGKLNPNTISKLKEYLQEKGRKTGGLERSITSLNDAQQAKFALDKIYSVEGQTERASVLQDLQRRGILTDNVIAEMKKLVQSEYQPKKKGFFEGLFAQ